MVARLLGHAQVQMTLRYAHVSDRGVEAAAERIGGAMAEIMNRLSAPPEFELAEPEHPQPREREPQGR